MASSEKQSEKIARIQTKLTALWDAYDRERDPAKRRKLREEISRMSFHFYINRDY